MNDKILLFVFVAFVSIFILLIRFLYVNVIKLETRVKFSLIKRVNIKQKVIKFFPLNGRRAHVNNI